MANTIEKQIIANGEKNLVIKVHIDGDGSGEESATLLIDLSAYDAGASALKLMRIASACVGFTAELEWDATANTHLWQVPDYIMDINMRRFGGIPNNSGSGKTGDIDITTTGLGLGDSGHILLEFEKVYG